MNVFKNIIGNWIQVSDKGTTLTIEDFGYNTGIIEGSTKNHCIKCVAVNQCCFKNEKRKKPDKFDLTNINIIDAILKDIMPGLYHYKCHCSEIPTYVKSFEKIELIIPQGKIDYLFKNKSAWINAMSYHENDYEKFVKILLTKTKSIFLWRILYRKYIKIRM